MADHKSVRRKLKGMLIQQKTEGNGASRQRLSAVLSEESGISKYR